MSLIWTLPANASANDLHHRRNPAVQIAMGTDSVQQDTLVPADSQDDAPEAGMTLAPKGVAAPPPSTVAPAGSQPPQASPDSPAPQTPTPATAPSVNAPSTALPVTPAPGAPGAKAPPAAPVHRSKKAPAPLPELVLHGLLGADVSQYQSTIDWAKLAAERKFVFIRASYGDELDPSFSVNWKAARDHGIPRGAYHFFNPQKSLRLQIRQFIQAVGKLEKGDLPPIIDLEDYKHNKLWPRVLKAHRVALLMRWVTSIEQALGVKPIIYMSPDFIQDTLGLEYSKPLKDYDLWVAHYDVPVPIVPQPWTKLTFWQYTIATCAGVIGKCDQDTFPGTAADLARLEVQTPLDVKEVADQPEETLLPIWHPPHRKVHGGRGRIGAGHHGSHITHAPVRGHWAPVHHRGGGTHCWRGRCR